MVQVEVAQFLEWITIQASGWQSARALEYPRLDRGHSRASDIRVEDEEWCIVLA